MIDYNLLYKDDYNIVDEWSFQYDLFISAYNDSERVIKVYNKINAKNKLWLMQPDYGYIQEEYPEGELFINDSCNNESDFIKTLFETHNIPLEKDFKICIDITGFIKPYMMTLIAYLVRLGHIKFDIIFTEPEFYNKKMKLNLQSLTTYK